MCINRRKMPNRKYTANDKNGGIIPPVLDKRQLWIDIPCGQCYVCRKKKAREWSMRLSEEFRNDKSGKVVLLTFSEKSLRDIKRKWCKGYTGYELDNKIAKEAVKHFRERWRKEYGRSIKHWFVTELGQKSTERIHLHGIVWKDARYNLKGDFLDEVERIWNYGFIGRGKKDWRTGKWINYTGEKTANYFVKYVNKIDEKHKEYKQIILTSAGIGKGFLESQRAKDNKYRGKDTNQMYNVYNGGVLPMPEYFRRKLYTDEERSRLLSNMLDKGTIYIDGREYRKDIGDDKINLMFKTAQEKNARMGYGDGRKNYERKMLENEARRAKQKEKRHLGREVTTEANEKKVVRGISGGVDEKAVWYERGVQNNNWQYPSRADALTRPFMENAGEKNK